MIAKAFPEMWGRPDWFWHAHNVVLNYGFQLGVAGILAVLGVFGGLFALWLRLVRVGDAALRAVGIAGALLVLGVFARNMTNDFFQRDQALLFWALTGALAGYAQSAGAGAGSASAMTATSSGVTQTYCWELGRALASRGHQVTIIAGNLAAAPDIPSGTAQLSVSHRDELARISVRVFAG